MSPGSSGRPPQPTAVRLHRCTLPRHHLGKARGLPVTTVARTVIDVARTVPFRDGVVTADSALHRRLTTRADLERVLKDCWTWRGVRTAAQVVSFADPLTESALKSVARVMFRDQGLPPPVPQVTLGDEHGVIGRVDFYWREHGTVGEADGLLKYDTPGALAAEKLREDRLRDAGFQVVRFTLTQVICDPERTAARLRAAFARAAALRVGR